MKSVLFSMTALLLAPGLAVAADQYVLQAECKIPANVIIDLEGENGPEPMFKGIKEVSLTVERSSTFAFKNIASLNAEVPAALFGGAPGKTLKVGAAIPTNSMQYSDGVSGYYLTAAANDSVGIEQNNDPDTGKKTYRFWMEESVGALYGLSINQGRPLEIKCSRWGGKFVKYKNFKAKK